MSLDVLILGNPENRRVAMFQEALERLGQPPARTMSYLELLRGERDLAEELSRGAGGDTVLRLESPGENFEVERELLRLGATAPGYGGPRLEPEAIERLSHDRGLILYPGQRFAGYRVLLEQIAAAIEATGARVMQPPGAVIDMFDKAAAYERLVEAGVPCPERLGPAGGYEEMRARMEEAGCRRAFFKLRYGSSASGVVAYRVEGDREMAITSAALVAGPGGAPRLYNSLRIRRYAHRQAIAAVIDELGAHSAVLERWEPKAKIGQESFDFRVVAIAGRARHRVARMSRVPMTNLHLGNRRGQEEDVRGLVGEERWEEIGQRAARALEAFDGALYAGVDVMVDAALERTLVLEVNAFGDLLPGLLHEGQDTYEAELRALLEGRAA